MERATGAHFEMGWSHEAPTRRGRALWRRILGLLRPAGRHAPTGPPRHPPGLDAAPAPVPPPAEPPPAPASTEAPPAAPAADDPGAGTSPGPDAAWAGIQTATAAIGRRPPALAPLISVVLVTARWPTELEAAVQSVQAQSHGSWELLVVDRRRRPEPPPRLAPGDGRVRVLAGPGLGEAAAHNRGLEVAQGQLVTYLGDTARMAPGWLAALAWAADEWPGVQLCVGTRLTFIGPGYLDPATDLVRLAHDGRAVLVAPDGDEDMSAVVHRRTFAPGRFEDGLDLRSTLLNGHRARLLPVLASLSGAPTAAPQPTD